jgi:hypothetical protein
MIAAMSYVFSYLVYLSFVLKLNFPIIFYINGNKNSGKIISQGVPKTTSMVQLVARFFPHVKEVEDIGLTNRPRKRSKFV